MRRAIGASVAALIALAPLCIPPAQARADDPCAGITDPTAYQACTDSSSTDDPMHGPRMGNCQASPDYGQLGQVCRNAWIRKSPPHTAARGSAERITAGGAPGALRTL